MSQTLAAYHAMNQGSVDVRDMGCELTELKAAKLTIKSDIVDAATLKQRLADWVSAEAWHQSASATRLETPEDLSYLLEGEWFDGKENSLAVRLVSPNQYQITEYVVDVDDGSEAYCYQEQELYLQPHLTQASGKNIVKYRQWFQCVDHAWQPIASQFLGFGSIKE